MNYIPSREVAYQTEYRMSIAYSTAAILATLSCNKLSDGVFITDSKQNICCH